MTVIETRRTAATERGRPAAPLHPAPADGTQRTRTTEKHLAGVDVRTIHWLLRVACAGEFIGHGAFGVITKAAWVPYFAVAGIPPATAYVLMPLIGLVDISMGLLVLARPIRGALLYMTVWGLWTATIRPLAGEPIWEWVERAPNWCVPLALLLLRSFDRHALTRRQVTTLGWILRLATAGALIGHGAFGVVLAKSAWVGYFGVLGISPSLVEGASLLSVVGWFEIGLGAVAVVAPIRAVLLVVVIWKISTELLRPLAGEPGWEFVERAANMLAPLALLYVRGWPRSAKEWLR
jgi:hypothetical protein